MVAGGDDRESMDDAAPLLEPEVNVGDKRKVLIGAEKVTISPACKHLVCFILPVRDTEDDNKAVFDQCMEKTVKNHTMKKTKANPEAAVQKHVAHIYRRGVRSPGCAEMQEKVKPETSFEEYSNFFREQFLELLQEEKGFEVYVEPSVDKDELLLTIEVPRKWWDLTSMPELNSNMPENCAISVSGDQAAVSTRELLASQLKMKMPLKLDAYKDADEAIGKKHRDLAGTIKMQEVDNLSVPAYAPVELRYCGEDSPYEDFKDKDLIRMIYTSIEEVFNLDELVAQGLIVKHFPVHKLEDINFIHQRTNWSLHPMAIPSYGNRMEWANKLREYFGEEVGFYFLFMVFNTRMMLIPAAGGIFMCFRRFLGHRDLIRIVQTIFAFLVATWAAVHCQAYGRKEMNMMLIWGARALDQGEGARPILRTYNPDFDDWSKGKRGWLKVRWYRFIGSVSFMLVLFAIVGGVAILQWIRKDVQRNVDGRAGSFLQFVFLPLRGVVLAKSEEAYESKVVHIVRHSSALLITLQIRIFDIIWDKVARKIVKKENHRTKEQETKALVYKLFVVKLVNYMYPFIYILFIKEWAEGCGHDDSCIPQTQRNLFTMFVSNAAIDVVLAGMDWFLAWYAVRAERKKYPNKAYTYLQVQAKLASPWDVSDDMLVFVIQFCFLCSFTIAAPFLPVFALLYNIVMGKLYMYRRLCLSSRNYPAFSEGIGVWNVIMREFVYVSAFFNTLIAVFSMHPIKDKPLTTKAFWFVVLEHLTFVTIRAMFWCYPKRTTKNTRVDEYNHDHMHIIASRARQAPNPQKLSPPGRIYKLEDVEVSKLLQNNNNVVPQSG
mmetsp:Transcript_72810/g.201860  ORF Transcript_72810/g.201860 Transcript_72810/m.201860 type:complete len:830 (-) Transcript_72810:59-2548(-)